MPLEAALSLFHEHSALFVDRPDGDIYPCVLPSRSEEATQKVFEAFYMWIGIYELTRQWLVEPAAFKYDFFWLTSKFSEAEIKAWADHHFQLSWGVLPDSFKLSELPS